MVGPTDDDGAANVPGCSMNLEDTDKVSQASSSKESQKTPRRRRQHEYLELPDDNEEFTAMYREMDRRLEENAEALNLNAFNVKSILNHCVKHPHMMEVLLGVNNSEGIDFSLPAKITRAKAKELRKNREPQNAIDLPPVNVDYHWPILDVNYDEDAEDDDYRPEKETDDDKSEEESDEGEDEEEEQEDLDSTLVPDEAEKDKEDNLDIVLRPLGINLETDFPTAEEMLEDSDHNHTELQIVREHEYQTRSRCNLNDVALEDPLAQETIDLLGIFDEEEESLMSPPSNDCWRNFIQTIQKPSSFNDIAPQYNNNLDLGDEEDDTDYNPQEDVDEEDDREDLVINKTTEIPRREVADLYRDVLPAEIPVGLLPPTQKAEWALLHRKEGKTARRKKTEKRPLIIPPEWGDSCSLISGAPVFFSIAELNTLQTQLEMNELDNLYLKHGNDSMFNVQNLPAAIASCHDICSVAVVEPHLVNWLLLPGKTKNFKDLVSRTGLRPEACLVLSRSEALYYPDLVPTIQPQRFDPPFTMMFSEEENVLLAMGLMQFGHLDHSNGPKIDGRYYHIHNNILPSKTPTQIKDHMAKVRGKTTNPLYVILTQAEEHYVNLVFPSETPIQQYGTMSDWKEQYRPAWYKKFVRFFDLRDPVTIRRKEKEIKMSESQASSPFVSQESSSNLIEVQRRDGSRCIIDLDILEKCTLPPAALTMLDAEGKPETLKTEKANTPSGRTERIKRLDENTNSATNSSNARKTLIVDPHQTNYFTPVRNSDTPLLIKESVSIKKSLSAVKTNDSAKESISAADKSKKANSKSRRSRKGSNISSETPTATDVTNKDSTVLPLGTSRSALSRESSISTSRPMTRASTRQSTLTTDYLCDTTVMGRLSGLPTTPRAHSPAFSIESPSTMQMLSVSRTPEYDMNTMGVPRTPCDDDLTRSPTFHRDCSNVQRELFKPVNYEVEAALLRERLSSSSSKENHADNYVNDKHNEDEVWEEIDLRREVSQVAMDEEPDSDVINSERPISSQSELYSKAPPTMTKKSSGDSPPKKGKKYKRTRDERMRAGLEAMRDATRRHRQDLQLARKIAADIRQRLLMHKEIFVQMQKILVDPMPMDKKMDVLWTLLSKDHFEVLVLFSLLIDEQELPAVLLTSNLRRAYVGAIDMICGIEAYASGIRLKNNARAIFRALATIDVNSETCSEEVAKCLEEMVGAERPLWDLLKRHLPLDYDEQPALTQFEFIDMTSSTQKFPSEDLLFEQLDLEVLIGPPPPKKNNRLQVNGGVLYTNTGGNVVPVRVVKNKKIKWKKNEDMILLSLYNDVEGTEDDVVNAVSEKVAHPKENIRERLRLLLDLGNDE